MILLILKYLTPSFISNRIFLAINRRKKIRKLEIGPGAERIPGFETLNIVKGRSTDFVSNAAGKLPFRDAEFDYVYASHILEHIPWYQVRDTLMEWKRILKPNGRLDIWVPDGFKICETLCVYEKEGLDHTHHDGWYRFNDEKDPCKWASGRLFTYGDGTGKLDHPNWHRALFTPRYLSKVLAESGFEGIEQLSNTEVLGYDHGWINLGFRSTKPSNG